MQTMSKAGMEGQCTEGQESEEQVRVPIFRSLIFEKEKLNKYLL